MTASGSCMSIRSETSAAISDDAMDQATYVAQFESIVNAYPQQLACRQGDLTTSYERLDAMANRLANVLLAHGIGREDVVAIVVPRSPDMLAALLGVAKAGAAFLPIDVKTPKARIDYMLADASAVALLTTSKFELARSSDGQRCLTVIDVEAVAQAKSASEIRPSRRDPPVAPSRSDAAYVIYTSGSTGTPKGVVVTHAGIPNLIVDFRERLQLDTDTRFFQFASFGFDAAFSEIAFTLCSGGTLVLPSPEADVPRLLHALLGDASVTHVILMPTVLSLIPADGLAGVRTLIVAGEACPGFLVDRWSRGRRMINAYGPTEITVAATATGPLQGGTPPIGRPVRGTSVHLLDEELDEVGAGDIGELYVSGPGVARGYLKRPGLTAERFVELRIESKRVRAYRTGDLARWLPDGQLAFCGRADRQIKWHGHRIEPDEIEHLLVEDIAVRSAHVMIYRQPNALDQLVAYVTAPAADEDLAPRLNDSLLKQLPMSMVPSSLVVLPEMPLTPNGKLDVAALPPPRLADRLSRRLKPETPGLRS